MGRQTTIDKGLIEINQDCFFYKKNIINLVEIFIKKLYIWTNCIF
jgi:hypothetical protein